MPKISEKIRFFVLKKRRQNTQKNKKMGTFGIFGVPGSVGAVQRCFDNFLHFWPFLAPLGVGLGSGAQDRAGSFRISLCFRKQDTFLHQRAGVFPPFARKSGSVPIHFNSLFRVCLLSYCSPAHRGFSARLWALAAILVLCVPFSRWGRGVGVRGGAFCQTFARRPAPGRRQKKKN